MPANMDQHNNIIHNMEQAAARYNARWARQRRELYRDVMCSALSISNPLKSFDHCKDDEVGGRFRQALTYHLLLLAVASSLYIM